jgi:D-apionolactonase
MWIKEEAGRFTVEYRAVCADANQRLQFAARIIGSNDGGLVFDAVATPDTDFVTNRAGFVVLHPAWLAGQKLRVTHVDDREEETRFPIQISPSQPIFDIRALSHEVAPALWATCRMEGDTFEMEDQRNWTDASYKTYVRPLALPWGYTLAKGSRHEQSVRLSFTGRRSGECNAKASGVITIELGQGLPLRIPELGVALPNEGIEAASAAVNALCALSPRFLVCYADIRDSAALSDFDTIRQVAEAAAAKIVLEVVVPDEADVRASLEEVATATRRARLEIDAVVVSSAADLKSWQPGAKRPEKPSVEDIAAAAREVFPGVKLGGGMLSTFTELNRKRPKAALFDFITHTTCSIVHAADDRSVMETLETLPAIIASTRAMIGEKPYRIGPSAIAARMNPYGKAVLDNPSNRRVCLTNYDPRQRGLFNAAWTLSYIAACAYGGGDVGHDWRARWATRIRSSPCGGPFPTLFRFDRWYRPLSGVPCDGRSCSWGRPSSRRGAVIRTAQGGSTGVAGRDAHRAVARKSYCRSTDDSHERLRGRAPASERPRFFRVRAGCRPLGYAGRAAASTPRTGAQSRRLRSRARRRRY